MADGPEREGLIPVNAAPSITAIIPARNEAHRIRDCIESLRYFADEILVIVDETNTDDTPAVSESCGARVLHIGHHRTSVELADKEGFLHAKGEWLFMIDADEHLTPTLAERLREVARDGRYAGVRYARKNMMFGAWAKHGGWFRSDQLRFFRSDSWDRSWIATGHSQVPVRGDILTLPACEDFATVHWDYDNVPQFIHRTLWRYSQQEAQERWEMGLQFSPLRLIFKPAKRFFGRYFLRGGWRDGQRGLILAALLAGYDLCTEMCLWDVDRRHGTSGDNKH